MNRRQRNTNAVGIAAIHAGFSRHLRLISPVGTSKNTEDTCHNRASFPENIHIKLGSLHLLDNKHCTPHEVACATPAQNSE